MALWHIIALAIVQGLTEFLPVSSSGHLILFSRLTNLQDQGVGIDVALHIGSLFAVVIYFRHEIIEMIKELFAAKLKPDFSKPYNRLAYLLLIASVPALIAGFCLRNFGMEFLRNPKIIGCTILFYGLVLYFADRFFNSRRDLRDIKIKDAILIGLAQCLALVPGTSRSGITITMGRFLKISRVDAAKFSMMLSIPVIAAAGCLEGYRLFAQGNISEILAAFDAIFYSFIASYVVIYLMMKWLQKWTYLPFVIYRVILGLLILVLA
ncbi:MAG TPA: undecaprenyl-diphosphate phosphatase [Alphaproteobacteria bacterium]|nr:undecaprenyl-diphosphate phosphatase [Alphaproteobacteria bacterium]